MIFFFFLINDMCLWNNYQVYIELKCDNEIGEDSPLRTHKLSLFYMGRGVGHQNIKNSILPSLHLYSNYLL